VASPKILAVNKENKPQPTASEEISLLESIRGVVFMFDFARHVVLCLLLLLLGGAVPGASLPLCGAASSLEGPHALRFSYPAIEDPTVTLGKYQKLLDAMAVAIGRPVSIILRNTYGEIVQDLEHGDADIGILNAFSYVEIVSRAKLTPLVRRVQVGRDTYQSYLIVRENAGIRRYQELHGKVIAFPNSRSTTGYLLPRLMLRRHHLELNRDFARVLFVGSHDSTALAVANGTAHAGALASYIYEEMDPAVQAKLDILDLSEPIPFGPIVARAALGGRLLERIRIFFVNLDRSPWGESLLRDARLSGFTAATDGDYAPIRDLVRRLREVGP
jgi:phosphonate transport system substrate-binding protein